MSEMSGTILVHAVMLARSACPRCSISSTSLAAGVPRGRKDLPLSARNCR
jgi:hypothetical protein